MSVEAAEALGVAIFITTLVICATVVVCVVLLRGGVEDDDDEGEAEFLLKGKVDSALAQVKELYETFDGLDERLDKQEACLTECKLTNYDERIEAARLTSDAITSRVFGDGPGSLNNRFKERCEQFEQKINELLNGYDNIRSQLTERNERLASMKETDNSLIGRVSSLEVSVAGLQQKITDLGIDWGDKYETMTARMSAFSASANGRLDAHSKQIDRVVSASRTLSQELDEAFSNYSTAMGRDQ